MAIESYARCLLAYRLNRWKFVGAGGGRMRKISAYIILFRGQFFSGADRLLRCEKPRTSRRGGTAFKKQVALANPHLRWESDLISPVNSSKVSK